MIFRRYFGLPDWNFRSQFDEFDRLRRQLELLTEGLPGRTVGRRAGVFPLVNLTEDKNNYYIRAELPASRFGIWNMHLTVLFRPTVADYV